MASTEIAQVPFYDDTIQAVQDTYGKVHVVIKRICESIEIDFSTQLKKLKGYHWACVGIITTQDTSSREQELCVLPLDQLPMWLATIDVRKVGEHVRAKLMRYQVEARDALARHFFGEAKTHAHMDEMELLIHNCEMLVHQAKQLAECKRLAREAEAQALEARQVADLAHEKAEEASLQAQAAIATLTNDTQFLALVGYSSLHKLHLSQQEMASHGKRLSQYCRANNIPVKQVHSEVWGHINAYPTDLLDQWFGHGVPGTDDQAPH